MLLITVFLHKGNYEQLPLILNIVETVSQCFSLSCFSYLWFQESILYGAFFVMIYSSGYELMTIKYIDACIETTSKAAIHS